MSNLHNPKYPLTGTAVADVVRDIIDELHELKTFRDFVLQDPAMQEQWEQYKTFRLLKDKA